MDIFVIILMFFAVLGFIDKAIGGKMGLENEIDTGLSTMGAISIYIVGIYCVGTTFVENNSDSIAAFTSFLPIDPSVLVGCILAPDLGGQPIALGIANDKVMGYFSGLVIGGCLGQFVSFQLPVIFSMLDTGTKQKMIRGFIYGITTVPLGLISGGIVMGIPFPTLMLNISIIIVVCIILLAGFFRFPSGTEKVLLIFSSLIKSVCQILFIIVVIGIFLPGFTLVSKELLLDALYIILRMSIIICGGLVLTKIITKVLGRFMEKLAKLMKTDRLSVVGLLLNTINTLTVVPVLKNMDENGKKINGAFSVSGAYILGGQMAFILLVAPAYAIQGYIVSKLVAGISAIAVTMIINKRNSKNKNKEEEYA